MKSSLFSMVTRLCFAGVFAFLLAFEVNAASPTISDPGDLFMDEDTENPVTFTVDDLDENNSNLVVSVTADDLDLFPVGSIVISTNGPNERVLTFNPADNENGSSSISVRVEDSDGNFEVVVFTMDVTPVDDAPIILGVVNIQVDDISEDVLVFTNLTIVDYDHMRPFPESLEVTMSVDEQMGIGEFDGINGPTETFTGSPQEVTDKLQAYLFNPIPNRIPVGTMESTIVGIKVEDSSTPQHLQDTVDSTVSVLSINDAPVVSATISPTVMNDTVSATPFSIAIVDPDIGDSFTATMLVANDPTAAFGVLNPVNPVFSGSKFEVVSAFPAIRYTPIPNVVLGQQDVIFEFIVTDAHNATSIVQKTLIVNEVPDFPILSGISSTLIRTDDNSPVFPFPGALIEDLDRSGLEPMIVSVTVSDPFFGSMVPDATSGLSPVDATAWLRNARFVPKANSVAVGDVEVVTLTVTVTDDAGNTRSDEQSRIAISGINGAPTIIGAPALGVVKSVSPIDPHPFENMYVSDDEITDLIFTIALDDADKGTLTSVDPGFPTSMSGYYVYTNDIAAISNLLNGLVFVVNTNHTFPAGLPGDTTFTLTVSDALENSDTVDVHIRLQEDLQNFIVTHTEDDYSEGSLRHAVSVALAGDHITFALPEYPALIRLSETNGAIALNRHVTIKGPGADMLRISGDTDGDGSPDKRIFEVNACVVMEGLTIESGTGQTGGGVLVATDGSLTMNGCVVKDCVADLWGGGIDVMGVLMLNNCLIKNNSTAFSSGLGGGGVSLYSTISCSFVNTTFSGNQQLAPTGYGGGGALFVENSEPQLFFQVDIQHCTFAENSDASTVKLASALSVITMGSDVRLLNSVFADGTGRNIQLYSGVITSQGGNISDDAATVLKSGASDTTELFTGPGDQTSVSNINLGPLTLLEGPTELYPLLAESAALNAGVASNVGIDQRRIHRTGTPDSGAYESGCFTRVVINEIKCKDAGTDFIELYIPRDSLVVDLLGYQLFVDGILRHTFAATTIDPGNGIIVGDPAVAALTSAGIPFVIASESDLDFKEQGVITLLNPAGQVVANASFVDSFPELTSLTLTDVSLTLAPQFIGHAYLPHIGVLYPPFGGWDGAGTGALSSPGADTASTVFGAENASPVAINDEIELGEDILTLISVLDNDLDADGSDIVVVTGLTTALSGTTVLGADYWMTTNPVTGYSEAVFYDPRTSQIFNSLPNGIEVSDSFDYEVADVGAGSIISIVESAVPGSLTVTAEGHRLLDGAQVQICGTDSYDGTYAISAVTDDTFEIAASYVLDETSGSWIAKALRGGISDATVYITVIGANDYPEAGDDAFSCGEEDVLRILGDPESGVIFDDAGLYPVPVSLATGNLLSNDDDIDTDDDETSLLVVGVLDSVTAIDDFTGTNNVSPVTVHSAAHGLTTGDQIVISGYSGHPLYNGEQAVTVIDVDTFTIPVVYVDNTSTKGVWGFLDDGNRLSAVSKLDASVTLDIRVDREETHLIYNPRGSATLNAISLGLSLVDTFYYAVEDSHGAVSIGKVDITVAGVNEDPDVGADPESLHVLYPFITVSNTLSSVLNGIAVVDAVGAGSGIDGRADARVYVDGTGEADSVVITDAWFTKESEILSINPVDMLANDSDEDSDDTLRVFEVFSSNQGVGVTLFGNTNIQYNAAGSSVMDALAQGEHVVDFFRAVITDDHGGFVTNLVVVIVEGVNDTPVSFDDAVTIDEDVADFTFDPTAAIFTNGPSLRFAYVPVNPNDYDVDINGVLPDNELWVISTGTNTMVSPHLALYSISNNLVSYHPYSSTNIPKHAVGPYGLSLDGLSATNQLDDLFEYTVSDQSFIFAENDLFRVEADGSGFVLNVLDNDCNYNVRGGEISISSVGIPDSRGTVSITADGSTLTYTPEINFVGDETFIYLITDTFGNIDKGRVTVRVTTELFNGDLQANHDAYSIALGETVMLDVLANDNRLPEAGSDLIITRLLTTTNQTNITLVNNKIQYVATTNALMSSETFSYEVAGVADGTTRVIADVAIRLVDRIKKLPVQNDFFTLPYGSVEQQIDVMANDFILPTVRNSEILRIDSTPSGTVSIDTENNMLRYTATPGFVGKDVFGYTITDNLGGTGSGTVTVFVGMPVATDDLYSVSKTAGTYALNVLENDQLLPGSTGSIIISDVGISPSNGTVTHTDTDLIFTSNGTAGTGTVSYVVSDGVRTAEALVTINTVDDGVYGTKDTFRVLSESENISLNVLNNDRSLPDVGRVLTITAVGTGIDAPDHGGTVVRSVNNKSLIYTPAPGFVGEETFTYTMTDTRLTDNAKVVVQVGFPLIAVNDDRFAVYHEGSVTEAFTLPVLYNDSFLPAQGGLLEIVGVGIEGKAPDKNGMAEVSPDGQSIIYQPNTNYIGTAAYTETFTYEAGDGTDARVEGTVEVTVYPLSEGRIPESNIDMFSVARNSTGNVLPVIANDGVMPDTAVSWSITDVSDPAFGGVASIFGSTIIYTPLTGFTGTDTFTYDVNNGVGSTVQAMVFVKVGSLLLNNDEYVVVSDSVTNELDVLGNDGIMPGPEFIPVIDTNVASAIFGMVDATTNFLYYTPSTVYTGVYPYVDTLLYGVIDDSGITQTQSVEVLIVEAGSDQSTSTVTFTVRGINDLPVLHNFGQLLQTTDEASIVAFPTSFVTDVDEWGSELLRVNIKLDDVAKGSLITLGGFVEISPGEYEISNVTPAVVSSAIQGLVYVPIENRIPVVSGNEIANFTVSVWDPFATNAVVEVQQINVIPINNPPLISGTVAGQSVYEHLRLHPFSSVTITEVDDLTVQPLNVEVQIDIPSNGYISSTSIFTDNGAGRYSVSNVTAAQVTEALRAMVFETTTNDRLSETNLTEITRLTIIVDDQFATPVVDSTTTVVATHGWVATQISQWDKNVITGFGKAVGSTRDLIAVGAPDIDEGLVSLYYRNLGGTESWGLFGNVVPTNVSENAEFGFSVAMQDDLLIVGAPDDADQGSVLIYQKDKGGADAWGLLATLVDTNGAAGDRFGYSVAISGDTLLVGATQAYGTQSHSGEVFVFSRNEGGTNNWGYVDSLMPPAGLSDTLFGFDVAIHENRIVVGAPADSSLKLKAGAAYTFARNSEVDPWILVQKVYGDNVSLNDKFGYSVDIYDDIAVIGAPYNDYTDAGYGSAYVFQDSGAGTPWVKVKVLKRNIGQLGYHFGLSVQVDGEFLVVGVPSVTYGVRGEVYVYGRHEGGNNAWGIYDIYMDEFNDDWNDFGITVSLEQETLAICSATDRFLFDSSGVLSVYRLKFNNGPVALAPVVDQSALVLEPFELILDPTMLFADADFEDVLTLSAFITPDSWLSFDSANAVFSGTPLSTGTVSVILIATDLDDEAVTNTFSVVVDMPKGGVDPHELWLAIHFGAGSSTTNSAGEVWAPDEDPDLDDLNNDQEYAFGTNPNSFDSSSDHIVSFSVDPVTGNIELTYRRRSNDPSLTFVVEKSTDLQNWTDAAAIVVTDSVTLLSPEMEEMKVVMSAPGPGPRYFFRIFVYD
ncbi:MAG: Ig-like domain-containing protein [Kiritimatiellae bacterium]|nr:Ig-like domain-containing protein [Kiritimatiellia bacterium]